MAYEMMRHPSTMSGLGATVARATMQPSAGQRAAGQTSLINTLDLPPLQLLNNANARCAALLKPLWPAIDQLPISASARSAIKSAPVDGLLLVFWPLHRLATDIIERAASISGGMYTVGLEDVKLGPKKKLVQSPETDVTTLCPAGADDLRIYQALDAHLPADQRDKLQRLRVVVSYMVLVMKDPGTLAKATIAVFAERGLQGGQAAGDVIKHLGAQAQATVAHFVDAGAAAADAAKQAAQAQTQEAQARAVAAAQAAQNAVNAGATKTAQANAVAQDMLRRAGLGDVEPSSSSGAETAPPTDSTATAADSGAGTAAASTTGVVLTPELINLIVGLTTAGLKSAPALVTAAGGAAGAAAAAGKPPKTQNTVANNAANAAALQQQGILAKPSSNLSLSNETVAVGAAALLGIGFFVMRKPRKNPRRRKNPVRRDRISGRFC